MFDSFQNSSKRFGDRYDSMVLIPILFITAFCFSYMILQTDKAVKTTSNSASKVSSSVGTRSEIGGSSFVVTKPQATKLSLLVVPSTDETADPGSTTSVQANTPEISASTPTTNSIQAAASASAQNQPIKVPTAAPKTSTISTSTVGKKTAATTLSNTVKSVANTSKSVAASSTNKISNALSSVKK